MDGSCLGSRVYDRECSGKPRDTRDSLERSIVTKSGTGDELSSSSEGENETHISILSEGGQVLVTLSRPLGGRAAEAFFLLWQETALTNWGETTAFVYERKPTNDLGAKDARSSQRDARAKPTSDVSDPDADDDENASDGDDG